MFKQNYKVIKNVLGKLSFKEIVLIIKYILGYNIHIYFKYLNIHIIIFYILTDT